MAASFPPENCVVRERAAVPRRPRRSRRRSPRDNFSLPWARRILPPFRMKKSQHLYIQISVHAQRLTLRSGRKKVATYPVSTSRFGLGSKEGSFKTPTGKF